MLTQEKMNNFLSKVAVVMNHCGIKKRPDEDIDGGWAIYDSLEIPEFINSGFKKLPVEMGAKLLTLTMISINGVPGAVPGAEIVEESFDGFYGDTRSHFLVNYREQDGKVVFHFYVPSWYVFPAAIMELMLNSNHLIQALSYEQLSSLIVAAINKEVRLDFIQAKILEGEFIEDIKEALGMAYFTGFKAEPLTDKIEFWRDMERKMLEEQS